MTSPITQLATLRATITPSDKSIELFNRHWRLRVEIDGWLNPGYLFDIARNQALADEPYCYQLSIAPRGEWGYSGPTGRNPAAPTILHAQGIFFTGWSE